MKICVVTCWYPTEVNPGAGSFVATDATTLALEHDVIVVHLVDPSLDDGKRDHMADGVRIIRRSYGWGQPFSAVSVMSELRPVFDGADIIHTMACPSLLKMRLSGTRTPIVHTEHWSGILRTPSSRFATAKSHLLRALYSRPSHISAVSSYLSEALSDLVKRPVGVIPNIVSGQYHEPRTPDGTLQLLSIGSVTEGKEPHLAVETLQELVARGYDAHLTWAGSGPLLKEARGYAASLGMDQRVQFLGFVEHDDLDEFVGQSDVVLHTSSVETFSIVAAESLIAGRPVVIQETGGHADFATEPFARFPQARTASSFADAVERAHADRDREAFASFSSTLRTKLGPQAFLSSWNARYEEIK